MTSSTTRLLITAAGLAAGLASSGAMAFSGGHSDYGDSYINDAVKNPRYIEPYGDDNPSRYLSYYPRHGYYIRQRAARAYDDRGYYGRVQVQPYGYAQPYGYYRP